MSTQARAIGEIAPDRTANEELWLTPEGEAEILARIGERREGGQGWRSAGCRPRL